MLERKWEDEDANVVNIQSRGASKSWHCFTFPGNENVDTHLQKPVMLTIIFDAYKKGNVNLKKLAIGVLSSEF